MGGIGSGRGSLKEARSRIGQSVTVEGVANVDNGLLQPGKLSVYIQDEQAGIQLFSHDPDRFPTVREGDRLRVTGTVGEYRQVTQVMVDRLEVLDRGDPVSVESIHLSDAADPESAEALEGRLVSLEGYLLHQSESSGGGTNLTVIDENLQALTLRVWESTGINPDALRSDRWYTITGIFSQYRDTYQVLPRSQEDLQLMEEPRERPIEEGEQVEAEVEQVVDGDTLRLAEPVLGADNVRFLHIDTPETYHKVENEKDRNQMNHGKRATNHMRSLLSPGDEVVLKLGEEPLDDYGRLLAEVTRKTDGMNTNLEMVKKGYAITYFIWPFSDESVDIYSRMLTMAKERETGIWDPEDPLLEPPFVFRARDRGSELYRPVGDFQTKYYVPAKEWESVPAENRVFFNSEKEAEDAGYRPLPESRLQRVRDLQTMLRNLYREDEVDRAAERKLNSRVKTMERLLIKLEETEKNRTEKAVSLRQQLQRAVKKWESDLMKEYRHDRLTDVTLATLSPFTEWIRSSNPGVGEQKNAS
ncbi:thermonuclease family protein [Paludifilum halophilum]|uniref:TNase-like domain-containing protein n=1 Tax=Paludifilum halophilum TaxID=1642702 RepID=A0A235B5Z4_9BACL|nr:thermonuclease family protein [Paludifilum halophilum]OYD07726.1 hypothetical protein CHM34_09640 [Paludifilum halophilum]